MQTSLRYVSQPEHTNMVTITEGKLILELACPQGEEAEALKELQLHLIDAAKTIDPSYGSSTQATRNALLELLRQTLQ